MLFKRILSKNETKLKQRFSLQLYTVKRKSSYSENAIERTCMGREGRWLSREYQGRGLGGIVSWHDLCVSICVCVERWNGGGNKDYCFKIV